MSNDVILDPFIGSGTTGIATLKSGRKYVGFDTIQEYIDLANKRIQPHLNTSQLNDILLEHATAEKCILNDSTQRETKFYILTVICH